MRLRNRHNGEPAFQAKIKLGSSFCSVLNPSDSFYCSQVHLMAILAQYHRPKYWSSTFSYPISSMCMTQVESLATEMFSHNLHGFGTAYSALAHASTFLLPGIFTPRKSPIGTPYLGSQTSVRCRCVLASRTFEGVPRGPHAPAPLYL
jgi:hypothetical protein